MTRPPGVELEITADTLVGHLAAYYPQATKVLARHGVDFCCGGGRSIRAAADAAGLVGADLLAEIIAELESSAEPVASFVDAPVAEIIDHILVTYHQPLGEELPRLESMALEVQSVHGSRAPEMFAELVATFQGLRAELVDHMMKEEMILFPMIRRGEGAMADGPVGVMEAEHEAAGTALRRIRELTGDFTLPEDACNTWRALWHGLEALEEQMHAHIHLENNILFPRALAT